MTQFMVAGQQQTDGFWRHTGRLVVSCRLDNGTLVTITLPDDWNTLLARVAALEARPVIDAVEDLKYGN